MDPPVPRDLINHARRSLDRVADFEFDTGAGQGGGRWYPSIITLPSGDLAAFGGHPSQLSEQLHENLCDPVHPPKDSGRPYG